MVGDLPLNCDVLAATDPDALAEAMPSPNFDMAKQSPVTNPPTIFTGFERRSVLAGDPQPVRVEGRRSHQPTLVPGRPFTERRVRA
ncbi:hypothetical protein [Actinoallomurus soli]|uniref:hypothetical protein n=1 Tax=Actinoallomurus soli TaxID=2952535 RepID=UPI002092CD9D|nr:hypothetical protein [Actinoallomurus soli]MCO5968947.1 hypothetical protein [Actinoallomurus soli]